MLAITIVICIFLFMTTALILSTIEKKYIVNDELVAILEDLNERIIILEKKAGQSNEFGIQKEIKGNI